jgi:group I intron endonuclease
MYVGQASNILNRVNNYLNPAFLAHPKNAGIPICQALLKYGAEDFAFVILEYTPIDLLNAREIFYIALLQPYYNILPGGGSSLGFKHSASTIAFLSALATGRVMSDATKSKISAAVTGALNPFFGESSHR